MTFKVNVFFPILLLFHLLFSLFILFLIPTFNNSPEKIYLQYLTISSLLLIILFLFNINYDNLLFKINSHYNKIKNSNLQNIDINNFTGSFIKQKNIE